MRQRMCMGLLLVVGLMSATEALEFVARVDSGAVQVSQMSSGQVVTVSDSTVVVIGDSLFAGAGQSAVLAMGNGCRIIVKGPCRLALGGDVSAPVVSLGQGEVLLVRDDGAELGSLSVKAKGCSFVPVGTIAAVRFTRLGEPTTAVVKGKVRMEAPDGKSTEIEEGGFGTFDVNNTFTQGRLSPKALQTLQAWAESANRPRQEAVVAQASAPDTSAQKPTEEKPAESAAAGVAADTAKAPAAEPGAGTGTSAGTAAGANAGTTSGAGGGTGLTKEQPAAQPGATTAQPAKPEKEKKEKKEKKKKEKEQGVAKAAEGGAAPGASGEPAGQAKAKDTSAAAGGKAEGDKGKEGEGKEGKGKEAAKGANKPTWGLSAGPVTVGEEQWTRIAFSGDIPIWRFGVGVDVEVFLNADGQFDPKGWEFTEDGWKEAVFRKIRYLRFNHEPDPLFIKFGGLDEVTLSYGLVVDRFTNTLHYPDEKLLGLQFYLNNLTPVGVTLQTVVADFLDFGDDGGVLAGRLALKPLKFTQIPIAKGIDIGGLYAIDLNQFAPARKWNYDLTGPEWDEDQDNVWDSSYVLDMWADAGDTLSAQGRQNLIAADKYDTLIEHRNEWARRRTDGFSIFGLDMTVPLIAGKALGLDVYGQYAMNIDMTNDDDTVVTEGWGIGAPGVALRFGPAWARVEYRHTSGLFAPSYFGPYYSDQRLVKKPYRDTVDDLEKDSIKSREDVLIDKALNGIYGVLGVNILNAVTVSGTYQALVGEASAGESPLDQRFEVSLKIGDLILGKIPKLNKVEGYIYKTNIMRYWIEGRGEWDKFFTPTPDMYYGYRIGFEVIKGAGVVWDARYTFEFSELGNPIQVVSNVGIQASLTF